MAHDKRVHDDNIKDGIIPNLVRTDVEKIKLAKCDITKLDVDAIVNAANERMLGGGGVDGAIHRAAGVELVAACRQVAEVRPNVRCPTGESRITPGFGLPSRYVIHTVGPMWRGGGKDEPQLLASCYQSALQLAAEHELRTIAFPAISCGVYGYPIPEACRIAVEAIGAFLRQETSIETVTLVAFDDELLAQLNRAMNDH